MAPMPGLLRRAGRRSAIAGESRSSSKAGRRLPAVPPGTDAGGGQDGRWFDAVRGWGSIETVLAAGIRVTVRGRVDPFYGTIFVFRAKRADRVKLIFCAQVG
jgi:hypothetical protein